MHLSSSVLEKHLKCTQLLSKNGVHTKVKVRIFGGINPYLGVYYAAVHVFIQNVYEDRSRRTIAKRDFPFNLLTTVFLNSVRIKG